MSRDQAIETAMSVPLPFVAEFTDGREQELVAALGREGAERIVDALGVGQPDPELQVWQVRYENLKVEAREQQARAMLVEAAAREVMEGLDVGPVTFGRAVARLRAVLSERTQPEEGEKA